MAMQETQVLAVDNLFAASQMMPVVADQMTVAQVGALKRGTLLTESGTVVASGGQPFAVLAEDVDTTEGTKVAPVYFTGEFNADALIVADDATVAGVKNNARKVCIFIK